MGVRTHAPTYVVIRLDNTSGDRTRATNVFEARLEERVPGLITKVMCHAWDSQKPLRLTHVDRRRNKVSFDFRRTYEAGRPFAGRHVDGRWRAERRVAGRHPYPVHPEALLITVYYEGAVDSDV